MLPFDLTNGQRKAAWTILQDMEKSTPMNRLVQGEVGSGKTVVAAIAALNASESGFQTAFMAPTEILALQHYQTITAIFPDRSVALLTSSHAHQARPRPSLGAGPLAQTRNEIQQAIAKGHIDITIGTHAIIQQDIAFNKLGLVIVDEQHRFGVAQRKQLKDKSKNDVPHLLSMTATPIPRSLALALYGDLDITSIRELPAGRKPITTRAVDEKHRPKAYGLIRQEIKKGRQAFVICPLVEKSDILGAAAATQEYERLKKGVFRDTAIGLLHGKLKAGEKERVMRAFKSGELSMLVATSVVEVGVDVPNASIMAIEGADRFGLSQLHQFRGRIGRGEHASYCFLFIDSPAPEARERLRKFVAAKNGFEIAELDLQLRGPGKLYGTEQSGRFTDLKIATLADAGLLERTKEAAQKLLSEDPALSAHPLLASELARRSRELHFE